MTDKQFKRYITEKMAQVRLSAITGYVVCLLQDGSFTSEKFKGNELEHLSDTMRDRWASTRGNVIQYWIMPTVSNDKALEAAKMASLSLK